MVSHAQTTSYASSHNRCAELHEADTLSRDLNLASKQVSVLRKHLNSSSVNGNGHDTAKEMDVLVSRCRSLKSAIAAARGVAEDTRKSRDAALTTIGNVVAGGETSGCARASLLLNAASWITS